MARVTDMFLYLAPRERSQRFAACNPPDLGTKQKVWFVTDSILYWKKDTEGLGTKARKRKPEILP